MILAREKLQEKRKEGEYIPIRFDPVMKKIWGDVNHPERSAYLVSLILDLPYELISDHIEVIESEKRKNNFKEKGLKNDIVLKLSIPKEKVQKINIEMNNNIEYKQVIIDRSVYYVLDIFLGSLKIGEDYALITPVVQINFNTFNINNQFINSFYLQDDYNHKLTDKFKIITIDIAKCYEIYYNEDISQYNDKEKEIIKIGTLMMETNRKLFNECLEGILMQDNIKDNIKKDMDKISSDTEILDSWDYEWDEKCLRNGLLTEERAEGKFEGKKEKTLEIAKKMLSKKMPICDIVDITGLTEKELENLN